MGGHRLVEVAPGEARNHRQHLRRGQAHHPAAVQGGLREGCRPEPRDVRLDARQVMVGRAFFHEDFITL
jgi:hypothetical protein